MASDLQSSVWPLSLPTESRRSSMVQRQYAQRCRYSACSVGVRRLQLRLQPGKGRLSAHGATALSFDSCEIGDSVLIRAKSVTTKYHGDICPNSSTVKPRDFPSLTLHAIVLLTGERKFNCNYRHVWKEASPHSEASTGLKERPHSHFGCLKT